MDLEQLLSELKKRRVFRATALYLAGAFAVWQAVEIAAPALGLPALVLTTVIWVAVVGFPFAVAAAWLMDITLAEGARGRSTPIALSVASLAAVGLVSGLVVIGRGDPGASNEVSASSVVAGAPTISVEPFVDGSSDTELQGFGVMIADAIRGGVTRLGSLRVVHADAKGDADSDLTVRGSYMHVAGRLNMSAELVESASGRVLDAIPALSGPIDSLSELSDHARDRVLAAILGRFDESIGPFPDRPGHIPSFAAFQAYAEGDREFVRGNYAVTIERFKDAARLDPDYILPQLRTAPAFWNQGLFPQADSVLDRLEPRLDEFAPHERAYFAMVRAWLRGDHSAALSAARRITALTPASRIEYDVAFNLLKMNRIEEAIAQFASLDPRRGALIGWVGYWARYTEAVHVAGDHQEELRLARLAREIHPESIGVLAYELRAAAALGLTASVDSMLTIGSSMRFGPSSRWTPGATHWMVGEELRRHGHEDASAAVFRRGGAWYGSIAGRGAMDDRHRMGLLRLRYASGDFSGAEAALDDLVARRDDIETLGYRALLAERGGQAGVADSLYQRLVEWEDPYAFGLHLHWAARVAAVRGDHDTSIGLLRAGYAAGQQHGLVRSWRTGVAVRRVADFAPLRQLAAYQELLAPR